MVLVVWGHLVYAAYRGGEWEDLRSWSRASSQGQVEGQVLIFLVTSDSKWHGALSEELGWVLGKGTGFSWKWLQQQDCQEHLDKALRHMVWCFGLPCAGAGIGFDDSFGSFQLRKFYHHRNIYSKILWMKYEWEFKYAELPEERRRKEWFMSHRLACHQDPKSLKCGFTGDFAQVRKSSFKKTRQNQTLAKHWLNQSATWNYKKTGRKIKNRVKTPR